MVLNSIPPPLGFRFVVGFFVGGFVPNVIDVHFQKVAGLSQTVETVDVVEGGQNFYTQKLPTRISHPNLTLTRGMLIGSPLVNEFNLAMSTLKMLPSNVLVSLLDDSKFPVASWLLMKAYPVSWSVADLDATANQVVIETMELTYQRLQVIRI